jgi:hypothetical protein
MATNTFVTPSWVTKDVAVGFRNNIKLIGGFDRSYDSQYRQAGAKMGYTVNARIEQRFTVSEGQAYDQQAVLDQVVPISINHQYHVDMGWSSADATMVVEEVQSRYTQKAGRSLANKWDVQAGKEVYKAVYFAVGTPGSTITSNQTWTDGVALMKDAGVPEELMAVITPVQQSALLANNQALFNPNAQISKYFTSGQFSGAALGMDSWAYDPNLPTHTTGTFTTSTPAIAGASQTGSSLAIDGMGTYALKAGDIFTIDGVNMVNPITYEDSGHLQQFSMQADLSGSTTATLSISPAIITSGQLQTVTAAPANNAAVSFLGSTGTVGATMAAVASKQSLVFNSAAFAFVMADLKSPLPGANSKRMSNKEAAISIRWSEQWNAQTDQSMSRLDTIGGIAPILPYYAFRAFSS